jgi:integrase
MQPADDRKPEKKRRPYSIDDLNLIFGALCREHPRDPRQRNHRFWLPLLALYQGGRQAEFGQALLTDIQVEDGIPCFEIEGRAEEGTRVKNQGSNRRIPLHPEVIRLGFLDYVEGLRQAGERRLFPLLRASDGRKCTVQYVKHYGKWLRTLGITDPKKVFHSFRHTFKQAARHIPEQWSDVLCGHAHDSEGRKYGEWPVVHQFPYLVKITYPGLVIDAVPPAKVIKFLAKRARASVSGSRESILVNTGINK